MSIQKMISIHVIVLALVSACAAEETAFRDVKLTDPTGKQANASLIFNDDQHEVIVQVSDHQVAAIPYADLDKVEYEYSKKHRITQGAIVMVASLGAGAVVMMTQSKSHWLYLEYHELNAPKTLVLRMDKKDYKKILASTTEHTGKEVINGGDVKKHAKNG